MPGYDAFLLVSFGGPEGPDDVLPFLQNVTAGRDVPAARLAEVAAHYAMFDGVSPINGQCRDLLAAIGRDFDARGIGLPLYWGNRNWHPMLADTLRVMSADGVRHALALATSAYSSYSSCRQYLDDIDRARAAAAPGAPAVDKVPPFFGHPGFAGAFAAATAAAIRKLPAGLTAADADLVFTAHSIPVPMAAQSGPHGDGHYQAQLAQVAGAVAARLASSGMAARSWRLAYTSRSGPPSVPWLEPDVSDCLAALAENGSRAVVLIPAGFVSDHMEVRYDLDVEAAATAEQLGLPMVRAATPGTDPQFVSMISSLVQDRLAGRPPEPAARGGGAGSALCLPGCCGSGQPASGVAAGGGRRRQPGRPEGVRDDRWPPVR